MSMYRLIIIFIIAFFNFSFTSFRGCKKIEISGNKRVGEATIKIYGNIEQGKDYSKKDLNNILENLFETNFFADVKVSLSNNILKLN